MTDQQATLNPSASNNFFDDLKGAVGEKALKTLEPQALDPSDQPAELSTIACPEKYTCSTQKPAPVTFIDGAPANVAALQVGFGKAIPRWKTGPNKRINFAAFQNGYPKPEWALLAATALKAAADDWNKVGLGVTLQWVAKLEDAAFVLSYAGNQGGVLAEAFFPNDIDLNVLNVYQSAFAPGTVQYLKNIFLHELGHVLGFRHEFAPEREDNKDDYTVQLGPRNPMSVMAYEFPPRLQTSDEESARAFYSFPGTELGWAEAHSRAPKSERMLKVVDVEPKN
ncbi:zincin [Aspergillus homomorphus CBS 101889]|uniref:Zincin n=1 Tax=Aspergillus homomorphus (strain CBS 101889) TaxID=1450537 RepID=A0A395HKI4_ASPHC|nr:zincin [Aspergillus homomorphus CBS 101889]RAL08452.1 zincin [Aspergillus homomorphus CBS 101889]